MIWSLVLTHCGLVPQNLVIIGSDHGLSLVLWQTITLIAANILSIGPSETNFNEICK